MSMDEARALLELQDLDLRLLRANKRLDEMPEKRDILTARSKLEEIRTLLKRTHAVSRAIEVRLKHLDDDAGAVRAKMETEQAKLLSGEIKNPKELQAIAMELDSLRRKREGIENEELAEMAKAEKASEQEAKVSAVLAAGDRKEAELVAAFRKRGGDLLGEIERLQSERAALAASLPGDLSARYEAMREAKHGIAVGRLEGDACGVCRVGLPAEQLQRLREGPPIGVCPKCQRMLVVENAE
jgi:predicted  nucleic acid-binding Zn-ribbon protein